VAHQCASLLPVEKASAWHRERNIMQLWLYLWESALRRCMRQQSYREEEMTRWLLSVAWRKLSL